MTLNNLLSVGLALCLPAMNGWASESGSRPPEQFQGNMLVSISDADMVGSAYVDGKLGPREGTDTLAVIPLEGSIRTATAYETEVSNSVAGPAVAVTVTPDGRYALVVETFKPRPDGRWSEQTFADLPIGNSMTVVDLKNPQRPFVVQKRRIGQRPDSVSINASGDLVAVTFHPGDQGRKDPVALIPFTNGKLGHPTYPRVPGHQADHRLILAEWHPTDNVLAVVNNTDSSVSFIKVQNGSKGYHLEPWGNTVEVSKSPYMARFTPDGQYLIVNGLYWGSDVQGTWVEAPRGDVVSIRLNADRQSEGSVRHALVSRAMTSVGPEGLTISPNGNLVVTSNVERSYLPYDDQRITWYSSITLMTLNPDTGELKRVNDYRFDGVLTEAAAFDASGQLLAVTNFDHFDSERIGGSVDFWRVVQDPLISGPLLVKTNHSVPVRRGVHSMVLVQ